MFRLTALVLLLLAPSLASAADRYALGRRVKALEVAWGLHAEPEARTRALPRVQQAVRQFFTFRYGSVARSLDEARHALAGRTADAATRWAEAQSVRAGTRLVALGRAALPVRVDRLYAAEGERPAGVVLDLRLRDASGRTVAGPLRVTAGPGETTALPLEGAPAGDHALWAEWRQGDRLLHSSSEMVSLCRAPAERLAAIARRLAEIGGAKTTQIASIAGMHGILKRLDAAESDHPARLLLERCEQALDAAEAKRPYFGQRKVGEWWLRLALRSRLVPARLRAPEAVRSGKPLPLVVALHGAGGSENMFFETYGNGMTARLCERRGWLMVSPSFGRFAFGGTPALLDLVGAVDRLYPVDRRRIFVVGHSMGAGQALGMASGAADQLAGLAILGGGRAVSRPAGLARLPMLIGAGDADFGRGGAEGLHRSLGAGAKARLKIYRTTEHLTVVQEALPDVFALFDRLAAGK